MLETQIKMLFGCNAIRLPIRLVVQEHGEGIVSFVGAIRDQSLRFGSTMAHQFVLGDAVIRPHLVMESEHCKGMGIASIMTSSSFSEIGEWVDKGKVILDPMEIIAKKKYLDNNR